MMITVRYVSGLPRTIPAGCHVFHNFPCGDPQRSPNAGGFRIFIARLEPGDVLPRPCKCGWAYKGGIEHYWAWKVKKGVVCLKRWADEAVARAEKAAKAVKAGRGDVQDASFYAEQAKEAVKRWRAAVRSEKRAKAKKAAMKCEAVAK